MAYGELEAGKRLSEHEMRQEMIRVGRLMWERGYVAATDGNLSARLGGDRLLVTASGLSKGFLSNDDLVVIRLDGEPVSSYRGRGLRASSEISMHLEVYRQRSDVSAVVHAHPPLATAFSIAGVSLARCVIPEVIVTMGGIFTAEYATPGTTEVPASIRQAIRDYDALIMAHHGSLTVGRTLWEAYMRLEKVEHTAEITLAAQQLGRVNTLAPREVDKLLEKRRELLQREGRDICEGCTVCVLGDEYSPLGGVADDIALVQQITQGVMRNLEGETTRR
ncbi:MAG: class II aldolase/adducin family protein [Anaerolineae bacterium]|jgi:L-fuculose-phosphate aldolase